MNRSKFPLLAAIIFVVAGFATPLLANDTVDLLTSGPWKVSGTEKSGRAWAHVRIFNKDGTFSTLDKKKESGRWKIVGGIIEFTFINGNKDNFQLPLNPDGTPGTSSTGTETTAVLDRSIAADGASPDSGPSDGVPASAAMPGIDLDLPADGTIGDVIALLKKNYPQYGYTVSSKKLNDVKLGEINLRGVTLGQLASALSAASNGGIAVTSNFGKTLFFREPASARPETVAGQQPKIDLDLPANSTLGDLVATLKKNYPDLAVNISSDKLNTVKIGELKLRGATLMELAIVLNTAVRGQINAVAQGGNNLFLREPTFAAGSMAAARLQPKIDLDLPANSTLGDFVATLKKNYPDLAVNISSDKLSAVKIGELKLRGVTLADLAGVLNLAVRGQIDAVTQGGNNLFLREPTFAAGSAAARLLPKIDLDLPANGTLGDLVATLKKNYPDLAVNISSDKLNTVKIGELKLRGANLLGLATVLNTAGRGQFNALAQGGNNLFLREPTLARSSGTIGGQRPIIDLDLPTNGTLGDLIAIVKKNYPDFGVNISSDKLNGVKIGELKLRGATLMELASVLNAAGKGQLSAVVQGGNNLFLRDPRSGVEPMPASGQRAIGIIDIDLPANSTLGDLAAMMKKKYPNFGVNIQPLELEDLKVGEIKLQSATLPQLAAALNAAGMDRFVASTESDTNLFLRESRPSQH